MDCHRPDADFNILYAEFSERKEISLRSVFRTHPWGRRGTSNPSSAFPLERATGRAWQEPGETGPRLICKHSPWSHVTAQNSKKVDLKTFNMEICRAENAQVYSARKNYI